MVKEANCSALVEEEVSVVAVQLREEDGVEELFPFTLKIMPFQVLQFGRNPLVNMYLKPKHKADEEQNFFFFFCLI